jgi:N-acetyl-gamma-glutamyl-phosphate reductase
MTRGILTTIYARINQKLSREDIHDCISSFYSDCPFIRIFNEERPPDTLYVRGTNYCDIGFKLDQRNRRLILISAIDNLIKGASGQAVQNMNIMLGFDETSGLIGVPFPI